MLFISFDCDQYKKWKQYLSKFKDEKIIGINFENFKIIELFAHKLTDMEFKLNKFYIDYCNLEFDKDKFYSKLSDIIIKSFLFNKIDNLITSFLNKKNFDFDDYITYMNLHEKKLSDKIPNSFIFPYDSDSDYHYDYCLDQYEFIDIDWFSLCSAVIADKPQIYISQTLLTGRKLIIFKDILCNINSRGHKCAIQISYALSSIITIEDLNNPKFNYVKDLIAEIWFDNYLLTDSIFNEPEDLREIIYNLI